MKMSGTDCAILYTITVNARSLWLIRLFLFQPAAARGPEVAPLASIRLAIKWQTTPFFFPTTNTSIFARSTLEMNSTF